MKYRQTILFVIFTLLLTKLTISKLIPKKNYDGLCVFKEENISYEENTFIVNHIVSVDRIYYSHMYVIPFVGRLSRIFVLYSLIDVEDEKFKEIDCPSSIDYEKYEK